MAIIIPIVTDYSDKGMQAAMRSVKNAEGPLGKLNASMSLLGPALATAGIAAAGFAIKLGVDAVQAAIAEEKEIATLHTTLENLGFGAAAQEVDDFVAAQAAASTFSDSNLRPALAELARVTGDLTLSQDLLTLAMDASVGSGKDLDSVTTALAKAAAGNTTALQKMFPELDKAKLSTEGLDYATDLLAERFAGQSAAAAETWAGKLGNVTEAFGELQESFGAGFLEGMGNAETGGADLATSLLALQDTVGELGKTIGEWLATLVTFAKNINDMRKAVDDFRKSIEDTPWAKVFDVFGKALSFIANGPILFLIDQINNLIQAISNLKNLDFSLPSLPSFGGQSVVGASARTAAPAVNVTINGAIDPVGTARAIRRVLTAGDLRGGRGI